MPMRVLQDIGVQGDPRAQKDGREAVVNDVEDGTTIVNIFAGRRWCGGRDKGCKSTDESVDCHRRWKTEGKGLMSGTVN